MDGPSGLIGLLAIPSQYVFKFYFSLMSGGRSSSAMLFAAERYFRSCRGGVFHRGGIGGSVDQFPEFYFG